MTNEAKNGAIAALAFLEAVLRLDARVNSLMGREIYGDGLQDAGIRAGNLRAMIKAGKFTVDGAKADEVLRTVRQVESDLNVEALVPVGPMGRDAKPGIMP